MRSDEASVEIYLDTVFGWSQGALAARMPGSENGTEFFRRFDEVVGEVDASGVACALLVSHGAAIRSWSAVRATNLDADRVARRPLDNIGVVVLDGSVVDGWVATSWMGRVLDEHGRSAPDSGPTGEPLIPPRD